MTAVVQRSFAGGEIAPSEWGRVDLVKFATGLAIMRNWFTQRHGGSRTRPGLNWVCHAKDMSDKIRLVPFKVSKSETYMHLHTDTTLRVVQDGKLVTVAATSDLIEDASTTNPCVLTMTGHSFVINDEITVDGVVGMIQLNGRNFKILNTTVNTVTLGFLNGDNIDATGFNDYVSDGTADEVFEETTPYTEAVLSQIHHSQTAAVMTLTQELNAVQNLTRIAVDDWLLEEETFLPKVPFAENAAGVAGAGGSLTFKYKVTSIDPDDGQESLPAVEAEQAITDISEANPAVVTIVGHGYENGEIVELRNLGGANGMDELNNRRFTVANKAANTFELKDEDSTLHVPYVANGDAAREEIVITSAATPTVANPNVLTWDAVTGITRFAVYKEQNGEFGFIGVAVGEEFKDIDIDPELIDTPPGFRNPFFGTGNFPATSGFYQQRRGFGRTINDVELINFSEIGDFKGFRRRNPLQDDDSVRFKLEGREINDVQHIMTVNGKLIILTESGEWLIRGDSAGTVTPIEINPLQQSYNGSNNLAPVIVNNTALYVQALASAIYDINFDVRVDGFDGNDLTTNSAHLFEGRQIISWAFQKVPHSIVWMVLDNGIMVGMTFNRVEKMLAFHRHDVEDGLFEDVAVITEGNVESVYLVVKYEMDITGTGKIETVRNVERMAPHFVADIEEAIVMDSAITIDGRNTDTTHTMTLTGGTNWDHEEVLTLNTNLDVFLDGMVDNDIIQLNGTRPTIHPVTGKTINVPVQVDLEIEGFISSTEVTVRPNVTVPVSLQGVATDDWALAIIQIDGLWHLEGEPVSVYSDGVVIGSAKNKNYDNFTVKNGLITLDYPRALNNIGRPITADMETLDIDTVNGQTMADKRKIVNNLTLYLEQSFGLWVGPKAPSNDDNDAHERLRELRIGGIADADDPVTPVTGARDVVMSAEYSSGGRVFIRNTEPVPAAVLQVVPRGRFPQGA